MTTNKFKIVLVLLFLIIAGFGAFNVYNSIENQRIYKENLEAYNKILDDSVKHYKTENGKLKFEKGAVVVDKENLEAALTYAGEDIKALKKEVGSLKNIIVFYKNKLESIDTIRTYHRDTVYIVKGVEQPALTFDWTNKHLSIKNAIIGLDSTRTVSIPYKYNLEFKAITHVERKFLKKNQIVTKFEFLDPNLVPVTSTTIYVPQEKKFYETLWFQGGAGLIVGFLIAR